MGTRNGPHSAQGRVRRQTEGVSWPNTGAAARGSRTDRFLGCSVDNSRNRMRGSPALLTAATVAPFVALASTNQQVQWSAIDALEEIGESAMPALIQALKSSDKSVRCGAASVLGKIRPVSHDIVTALIESLKDESEDVSHSAGYALGHIGLPASLAIPALIEALGHKSPKVREGAGWALGHMGPAAAAAIPALTDAMQDPQTRWRATWALDRIRGG